MESHEVTALLLNFHDNLRLLSKVRHCDAKRPRVAMPAHRHTFKHAFQLSCNPYSTGLNNAKPSTTHTGPI
jgi:hypothetical protein